MREHLGREHPAKGVYIFREQATIVFLAVCSLNRQPKLTNSSMHDALVACWREADAWLVGFYLIMPDHVHLFCSPQNEDYTIERWITFWKRRVRHLIGADEQVFQAHSFHHRLRRDENYAEKWTYVRMNAVRATIVTDVAAWPYQGILNELRW